MNFENVYWDAGWMKDDCRKFKTAAGCYRTGDEERTLAWLMKKIAEQKWQPVLSAQGLA